MGMAKIKTIKPDAKGRIYLGDLAEGISSFKVMVDKNHRITLEPYVEIPAREKWLFANKVALKQVQQGLKDASKGKVVDRGKFSDYLNEELDD